jgi:hypothetical protein
LICFFSSLPDGETGILESKIRELRKLRERADRFAATKTKMGTILDE